MKLLKKAFLFLIVLFWIFGFNFHSYASYDGVFPMRLALTEADLNPMWETHWIAYFDLETKNNVLYVSWFSSLCNNFYDYWAYLVEVATNSADPLICDPVNNLPTDENYAYFSVNLPNPWLYEIRTFSTTWTPFSIRDFYVDIVSYEEITNWENGAGTWENNINSSFSNIDFVNYLITSNNNNAVLNCFYKVIIAIVLIIFTSIDTILIILTTPAVVWVLAIITLLYIALSWFRKKKIT